MMERKKTCQLNKNTRLNPSQLYHKIEQHFIAIHCFGPAGINVDNSFEANL